jgi:hypothetical protein
VSRADDESTALDTSQIKRLYFGCALPDKTVRYRADSSLAYSLACLRLMEHARSSGEDFEFGPLTLEGMREEGLVVTGPDLESVGMVLAGIPGLVESDA